MAAAAPVSSDHEPVNPAVRQLAVTAGQLAPDEIADVLRLVKYNVA